MLFKLDKFGHGEEILLEDLVLNPNPSFLGFSHEMFMMVGGRRPGGRCRRLRSVLSNGTSDPASPFGLLLLPPQTCIMAGCDFLSSLPNIGMKKSHQLIKQYRDFVRVSRAGGG